MRFTDLLVCVYFALDSKMDVTWKKLVFFLIFQFSFDLIHFPSKTTAILALIVTVSISFAKFDVFQKSIIFLISNKFYAFSSQKNIMKVFLVLIMIISFVIILFNQPKIDEIQIISFLAAISSGLSFSYLFPSNFPTISVHVYTSFTLAILGFLMNFEFHKSGLFLLLFLAVDSIPTDIPELHFTNESKRLLSFFTINFIFMFAEFIVGFSTNSLGLISDAFHMLCDNISLFCSVAASLISGGKSSQKFPFGLSRIETVCSFANTCLLFFISFNLLSESISRMLAPPTIGEDGLVVVSVMGLVVNLLGLFFTNTGDGSTFTRTIFLHVFVDTMGSVAVILSSICVVKFGWYFIDPICSFCISISIFFTTIPLMMNVVSSLLLSAGSKKPKRSEIENIANVIEYTYWESSEGLKVATLKCNATNYDNEGTLENVAAFFNANDCNDYTIEISSISV